jgi:predicted dehydrogenase
LKILILGCGSIGARHAKNLKSLGIRNLVLCDTNDSRLSSLGDVIGTNLLYNDYKNAVKENPDIFAAVICTPTALHIEPAMYFAKNKINLFIEKPLSNNLKKLDLLRRVVKTNNLVVMMGHSYMFEEGFIKLHSLLKKGIIGQVYYVTYLQGQYLPDWHPNMDYRKEYSARKELGGGALLTLTSHTFYVIEWLFGRVQSIHGHVIDKVSKLQVNADDSVFLLMRTKKNIIVLTQNNFIVAIHNHRIIVEGTKGTLEYDFVEKQVTIFLPKKKPKIIDADKGSNDRFVKEMKYFLYQLKRNNLDEDLNLESGIRFLKTMKNIVTHRSGCPL